MIWKNFLFMGILLTSVLGHELFDDDGINFQKNETNISLNVTDTETENFDVTIVEIDETNK